MSAQQTTVEPNQCYCYNNVYRNTITLAYSADM